MIIGNQAAAENNSKHYIQCAVAKTVVRMADWFPSKDAQILSKEEITSDFAMYR